jgi:hypothetical protein
LRSLHKRSSNFPPTCETRRRRCRKTATHADPFVGCKARRSAVDNAVDTRCAKRWSFAAGPLARCFCIRFTAARCGAKKACTGPPELLCLVLKTRGDTTYSRSRRIPFGAARRPGGARTGGSRRQLPRVRCPGNRAAGASRNPRITLSSHERPNGQYLRSRSHAHRHHLQLAHCNTAA